MSKRISRVNELLQRELSEQLRQRYRSQAVKITISEVQTSPDLRNATIYYSVLGGEEDIRDARKLFRKAGKDLRRQVSQHVILKYFPAFEFVYDPSMERGSHILDLLDELDEEDSHREA
ncbi:30S ribosome-binding factor RbfA [Coraliomargarita akajimensis]|uniref:Ribosome-binding factor A n=1 Tax=Coraliomargarita akajimensis (strain DSM 45221 / IAM 15411 / JCM 23193 / KCTC 12865 / 04OKA010-24) TaxID=583355 RepID=D5EK64_CORAD|nr:30S ribosome-binding factor RbfA [Coraliomargarita akajimensis]ADE54813.1 ribosome-binding factor A [Coraliomargarita akajimensis DSM 45221]